MGQIVMAVYQPKAGCKDELSELMQQHGPLLAAAGLVTERQPWLMRAQCGTIVEVFEWINSQASELAHENQEVQALWDAMAAVSEFKALSSLAESNQPFAEFSAIESPDQDR